MNTEFLLTTWLAIYFGGAGLLAAVALARPRVYQRASDLVGKILLLAGVAPLLMAVGGLTVKLSLLQAGAYAFAITTAPESPDYSPDETHVMGQISGSADAQLFIMVGFGALILLLYATHLIALKIAVISIKDDGEAQVSGPAKQKAAKTRKPGD